MKEDLSAGNYAAAFQLYAADCDQMITRARDDNPFSEKDLPHESLSPLILPICLIIGLVAALILFTIFSKGREARVRKKIYKSIRIFRGKADVGAYYLSEEFIEQLMLGKEYEFDEETLSEAGLAILTDRKYRGEKFIGTQRMGREIFEEGDRRYQYSVPYQSDGDMVTVIGIQEQGTLTYVKGATPNMLSGELDKKTALKKSGMSSGGVSIFRVVLTILLLSTGIRMLLKKRDQKEDGSGL